MAYMNRAICYSDIGRYDLTIADCSKVIELEPNLIGTYNQRALATIKQGKLIFIH